MSSREHLGRPSAGRSEPRFPTQFDKAFPVYLEGERGVASGIGRNITASGMFVETREPFPLGSRVRVTFTSPGRGPEMILTGEVRYQCFINYARADSARAGMRAIGLRFVAPSAPESARKGSVH
jgi:Tfp pilus assembly protein PilZ